MSQRVLHVVTSLVPQAGSLGVVLPGLFRALTASGWEPAAAVLDGRCDVEAHCPVHAGHGTTAARLVEEADLVHIHGAMEPHARPFAKAARKQRKPYILAPLGALSVPASTGNSFMRRLLGPRPDAALFRAAARIHAMSTLEANQLTGRVPFAHATRQRTTPLPPERVTILPYGIDGTAGAVTATSGSTDSTHHRMLVLGPIEPTEGAVVLLKAMAEVGPVADGWHAVIAGPNQDNYRAMLEAGIQRKGGEGRVAFASAATIEEQRGLLANASLLVAAGLRSRPPVSIMQAVSLGVPVLATDFVAPDELAEHLFVCRANRAELRTRLREVLELDDTRRRERGAHARECLRARLDWSVLAGHYSACYHEVLLTAQR